MSGQWWQHLAVGATALAAIGSYLQARKAIQKAEHDRLPNREAGDPSATKKDPDGLRLSNLWRKRTGLEFNVEHFRHVALLWLIIMVGSIIAFAAEIIDWAMPAANQGPG
jgi:hypothetical protein